MNELYKQLRTLIRPYKSQRYKDWAKNKFPNHDLHHLIGSVGSLKLTDILIAPVSRQTHIAIEKDKDAWFYKLLPTALNLLTEYVEYLEKELAKYEGG